jgi:hypothetical protein
MFPRVLRGVIRQAPLLLDATLVPVPARSWVNATCHGSKRSIPEQFIAPLGALFRKAPVP